MVFHYLFVILLDDILVNNFFVLEFQPQIAYQPPAILQIIQNWEIQLLQSRAYVRIDVLGLRDDILVLI